jgi:hypothetical protein
MPSFIPAIGSTLTCSIVWVNRIGKVQTLGDHAPSSTMGVGCQVAQRGGSPVELTPFREAPGCQRLVSGTTSVPIPPMSGQFPTRPSAVGISIQPLTLTLAPRPRGSA